MDSAYYRRGRIFIARDPNLQSKKRWFTSLTKDATVIYTEGYTLDKGPDSRGWERPFERLTTDSLRSESMLPA